MHKRLALIIALLMCSTALSENIANDLSGLEAIPQEIIEQQQAEEEQVEEEQKVVIDTHADLTVGYIAADTDLLNPLGCNNWNLISVGQLMFESVVDLDGSLKPSPMLADSWTHEDYIWHFKLREGVLFHSGQELTADDVIVSYQALLEAGAVTPYYSRINAFIAEMYAESKYDLTVIMRYTGYMALYGMVFPVMQQASVDSVMPMGTGPYWYGGADDEGLIRLEANPYWWKNQPLIHSVLFRRYPEASDALEALQLGEVEAISTKSSKAALSRKLNDLTCADYTTLTYEMLVPNLSTNSIMSDMNVRQAVMYAIDTPLIASNAYLDMAIQCEVPIQPVSWLYDSQSAVYYYSPERAIQMMHIAGWYDLTGNGLLNKQVGMRLREPAITIITCNEETSSIRENAAEMIASYLKAVGFDVQVEVVTRSRLTYRLQHRDFDLALIGVNLSEVPSVYNMFHKGSSLNFNGNNNDKMNKLLKLTSEVQTAEELEAVYSEMQKTIVERLPIMGLLFRTGTVLSSRSLTGISGTRAFDNFNGLEFVSNN